MCVSLSRERERERAQRTPGAREVVEQESVVLQHERHVLVREVLPRVLHVLLGKVARRDVRAVVRRQVEAEAAEAGA